MTTSYMMTMLLLLLMVMMLLMMMTMMMMMYAYTVDNDPHFVVSVNGLKEAVCFDVDGRPGFVYQLLHDKITGIYYVCMSYQYHVINKIS